MEQSLQAISKQERLECWTARIMSCRNSGMTVRAWCVENGVSEKSYFYWQRQLYQKFTLEKHPALPTFAEITPVQDKKSGIAATIRMSGIEADIYSGADLETVKAVLEGMRSC